MSNCVWQRKANRLSLLQVWIMAKIIVETARAKDIPELFTSKITVRRKKKLHDFFFSSQQTRKWNSPLENVCAVDGAFLPAKQLPESQARLIFFREQRKTPSWETPLNCSRDRDPTCGRGTCSGSGPMMCVGEQWLVWRAGAWKPPSVLSPGEDSDAEKSQYRIPPCEVTHC